MTTTPDLWPTPLLFLDNTSRTGDQDSGVVAATADDQFFAVWVDRNLNPDNIIARKFASFANPITGEVNLTSNSFLFFNTDQPAAVRLPIAGQADGLAVAFTYELPGNPDIYLVRTDAALNRIGNFITIDNSTTPTDHPSITSFADGSLWVSYTIHNGANNWDINAKRIDAAGNVTTAITLFDPGSDIRADRSDLATLANGNFVAVFERDESFNSPDSDVFFTIKTNAGDNVISPTGVNGATDPARSESDAHVAALADGGFVVTWTDEEQADIRAAVYGANGDLVQGNILVNLFNQEGGEGFSDVTALPDGGFIVAWADNIAPVERAQRFDEAGNLVGTPFTTFTLTGFNFQDDFHINAATYSDGRAILTTNVPAFGIDVQTWILDSRITDANQTTGENFFGAGGGPADLFLIRDTVSALGIPVRQLEAIQTNGTATVFGTVGTNQHFVGSGDFNGDGLSDLLINVDNPATQQRTFLVDQMNPDGIQAQFQIAVRGADWIVDGIGDFQNDGTSDILVHLDVGPNRVLEVMVMNNDVVQSNVTLGVNTTTWDLDGIGDFNGNGTSDILQHEINANGLMTLRSQLVSNNVVQSVATLAVKGADWQVDGVGDFNGNGTDDILLHRDSGGVRTFEVLTIQNNAVVSATTIAQTGTNISVGGIGDFNNNGTDDFLVHQDAGTTRTDTVYNVVNNVVVSTQTIAMTGIDWHVA
jgi:hypothetical protein